GLGLLDVVVGGLDELEQDVLHVLAHIARLGERGGICDGEGHVQHPRQRLGQERLAAARRAEQEDVGLRQLDVAVVVAPGLHPLVVRVHGDREGLLGVLLADDVVVQELVDLLGLRQLVEAHLRAVGELLFDDVVAQVDALVADVHARPGDQLLDLLLRLAAEGALDEVAPLIELRHDSPRCYAAPARVSAGAAEPLTISSMMPYSRASSAPMMKSRSVSLWMRSSGWCVCTARMCSSISRIRRISRAWISMSVACPPTPP